jgi:hypothetical protein
MNRRQLIPLIVAFFGLSSSLYSQAADVVKIRLRLLAFGPEQQIGKVFVHDPASLPDAPALRAEIKNYLNHESITVIGKSRKLFFSREEDRKSLDSPDALVGEVTLPAKVSSAILLFLPGKSNGRANSQVMVIDDRTESFPVGSYFVTNLSPQVVRIELEKKPFQFKPASSSYILNPPVRANNHSGMRTFAFSDNEWRPIASGLWPHPGRARSLLVLYPNPTTGTVNLRPFGDVPPRAPAETAASAAL